jgi:hypothetical protein
LFRVTAFLAMAVCAAGCSCPPAAETPPAIHCYLNSPELHKVSRVVFIQLADENTYPDVATEMTDSLFRAMQARCAFHMDIVKRADPDCQGLLLAGREKYTLVQIAQLKNTFDCDAILYGSITSFEPYPQMQMGLYLCMVDVRTGKTVWGVDQMWDTREKTPQERIKRYFKEQMGDEYDPVKWRLGLRSPEAFEKFVAYETAQTLGKD